MVANFLAVRIEHDASALQRKPENNFNYTPETCRALKIRKESTMGDKNGFKFTQYPFVN